MQKALQQEKKNLILWLPVFFGIGICIFFQIELRPSLAYYFFISFLLSLSLLVSLRYKYLLLPSILLTLTVLGFANTHLRTNSLEAGTLPSKDKFYQLTAKVEKVSKSKKGYKYLISNIDFTEQKNLNPKYINLYKTSDKNELKPGDLISVNAVLYAPPKPAYPDSYNYQRHAKYQEIGAIGFAVSDIKVTSQENSFASYINKTREGISAKFINSMGQEAGAIASALLVGDKSAIEKEQMENIRNAGLAHLLAISGMHLALIAIISFNFARLLLTLSQTTNLNISTKKIAAIFSCIVSLAYLVLSGMPISAQRAFIMTSIILFAILIDRKNAPLRSVSLAAMVILIIHPESIITPGFQMSFSAAIALIFFYQNHFTQDDELSLIQKLIKYLKAVIFSSLIAGIATMPYSIYHFNHIAKYGILANLIAIPITSFIIMPLGLILLCIMPFDSIFSIVIIVFKQAILLITSLAKYISALPFAYQYVPAFSSLSLILITLGFLILFFANSNLRYIAAIPIIIAIFIYFPAKRPDFIFNKDGTFGQVVDKKILSYPDVPKGFIHDLWQQRVGASEITNNQHLNCDNFGCFVKEHKLAISYNPLSLKEDCKNADIIIAFHFKHTYCKARYINGYDFYKKGNMIIDFDEDEAVRFSH